jgi:hypothetical protein
VDVADDLGGDVDVGVVGDGGREAAVGADHEYSIAAGWGAAGAWGRREFREIRSILCALTGQGGIC